MMSGFKKGWVVSFLSLFLFTGCAPRLSIPTRTFRIMVEAAREDNLDVFVECLDLNYLAGIDEDDPTKRKALAMTDPRFADQFESLLSYMKSISSYKFLNEVETGEGLMQINISYRSGSGEETREGFIFIHQKDKWLFRERKSLTSL